jgi:hypothetical protein
LFLALWVLCLTTVSLELCQSDSSQKCQKILTGCIRNKGGKTEINAEIVERQEREVVMNCGERGVVFVIKSSHWIFICVQWVDSKFRRHASLSDTLNT